MVDKQGKTYEVYRYRWTILLLFMFVALMTQVNWITFAPIMNELAEDYDVSTDAILLLTVSYMIVYIIMNFPATWAIDKYGLKWGTGFGVILTGVFGMGRAFAGSNYSLLLFMQVMTAIGQPFFAKFIYQSCSKLVSRGRKNYCYWVGNSCDPCWSNNRYDSYPYII